MKEFGIESCLCGKSPRMTKNEKETEKRYFLRCCEYVAHAETETLCMVTWNRLMEKMKPQNDEERNEE